MNFWTLRKFKKNFNIFLVSNFYRKFSIDLMLGVSKNALIIINCWRTFTSDPYWWCLAFDQKCYSLKMLQSLPCFFDTLYQINAKFSFKIRKKKNINWKKNLVCVDQEGFLKKDLNPSIILAYFEYLLPSLHVEQYISFISFL